MQHQNPTNAEIQSLLENAHTIAMVGASSNPDRSSHGILRKLLSVGYHVIPVNPNETEILGQRAVPSLAAIKEKIDIVDVFRRPEHTPTVAGEAVAVSAKALWLQSGIWNEEAAACAKAGGLLVVMDACIGVLHARLGIPPRT